MLMTDVKKIWKELRDKIESAQHERDVAYCDKIDKRYPNPASEYAMQLLAAIEVKSIREDEALDSVEAMIEELFKS